jgi:diamine N-acetyltransferase
MEKELIEMVDADFRLEKICAEEAAELSVVCREIYRQYYLYLWYDTGEWYQQMRYNPTVLAEELSNPQSEFYWIMQRGQKAGYLKINGDAQPRECNIPSGSRGLEIERIYLYREFAGRGLGQQTMVWAEAQARRQEYEYLFLYTMDSSDARLFYEKMGYQKVGIKRLPFEQMKPEYRDMYLMIKEIR